MFLMLFLLANQFTAFVQLWLTPISSESLILLLILLKLFLVSLFLKTLCLVVFFLHNFGWVGIHVEISISSKNDV